MIQRPQFYALFQKVYVERTGVASRFVLQSGFLLICVIYADIQFVIETLHFPEFL
jgi:hypothetical protein